MNRKQVEESMAATLEAAHLVWKVCTIGKHEQDREDATLWCEKYRDLLDQLREMRSNKAGPWSEPRDD